jgi:predicted AAA+ superfamily ATPase
MLPRACSFSDSSSFLLLGPRGTGKSTILRERFAGLSTLWIDLLDPETEHRFSREPGALREVVEAAPAADWVVLDEVQKVPALLDVVHGCIEGSLRGRRKVRFAMTGSSARKLKRGAVNLLAGRAFVYHLFPMTARELGTAFDLSRALRFGTLPATLGFGTDGDRSEFLRAYARTYLKEEVWSEHLIRRLDPFRRFLEVAAQCNGEILNYSNIARDVGVDHKTVSAYFEILEDTLLGFTLEPWHTSVRKRQRQAPKFWWFDPGVARALAGTLTVDLVPRSGGFGRAFEHFVMLEIIRAADYARSDFRFFYLRTKDDAEIDLIVERPGRPLALIEIKSTDRVESRHVRDLHRFLPEFPGAMPLCLSRDPLRRQIGDVLAVPWHEGLVELGL